MSQNFPIEEQGGQSIYPPIPTLHWLRGLSGGFNTHTFFLLCVWAEEAPAARGHHQVEHLRKPLVYKGTVPRVGAVVTRGTLTSSATSLVEQCGVFPLRWKKAKLCL